jgi:hypothetical protein
MTTHASGKLDLATAAAPAPRRGFFSSDRWRKWALGAAVVTLGALAAVVWFGERADERRALLRMDPDDRRALYEKSFRNAEALCEQAKKDTALLDRCEDAAAFLRIFPECDETCRVFGEAHRRGATR